MGFTQLLENVLYIQGRSKSSFPYCNTYIIKAHGDLVVIDPNCGRSRLRRGLAAWDHDLDDITAILNTHFHVDHSSHSRRLAFEYTIPVYMHRLDAEAITSWEDLYVRYKIDTPRLKTFFHKMFATVAGFQPFKVSHPFEPGDRLPAGIRIVHTPGHTPGHCGFQYKDLLFSGDVELNMPWVGNMHANVGAFRDSIQWLSRQSYRLLLPGHGPPVTMNRKLRSIVIYRKSTILKRWSITPSPMNRYLLRPWRAPPKD